MARVIIRGRTWGARRSVVRLVLLRLASARDAGLGLSALRAVPTRPSLGDTLPPQPSLCAPASARECAAGASARGDRSVGLAGCAHGTAAGAIGTAYPSPSPPSSPPPPPPPPPPASTDGALAALWMRGRGAGDALPREPKRNLLVAYLLWALSAFGTFGLHHVYLGHDARAILRTLTLGGVLGLGYLMDFLGLPSQVAVRNGRRQPALPSRDTVARFLARLADGALGGALLARPLALISRLPEHVCRLAGTTLVLALSSVAQGFRPPRATLLLAALAIGGLAAAELLRPRSALAALALALATHAYVPALLGLAWAVGKPVPLSALRFSGSRHASAASFPGRVARYLALSACYWALLLYGSDRIVAIEVYRPGLDVLRLSIGQFAARLARWSTLRAAWTLARTRLRGDGPAALLLAREALYAAFGAFSQLCLVPTLLEDGAARTGRETPRVCCSITDFTPRERPLRPADARRVLGVGPFADGHAIRKAYRRLALKYHPDKLRAQSERARASAEREFLRVQAAHQLLTKGAEKTTA